MLALVVPAFALGQNRNIKMQDEVLKVEKEFSQAIVKNDAEAVGRFLADDWIIIGGRLAGKRSVILVPT
jgi:hypothetical protein